MITTIYNAEQYRATCKNFFEMWVKEKSINPNELGKRLNAGTSAPLLLCYLYAHELLDKPFYLGKYIEMVKMLGGVKIVNSNWEISLDKNGKGEDRVVYKKG